MSKWAQRALCICLVLALASCGGGMVASSGVGTGGTGISSGTVTGFGSLVVDGTPYNSATAHYFEGNDQEDSAPTSATNVELGNQVQIQLDAQGNPTTVLVQPDAVGAVQNLTPTGSFTVNGVAVRINVNAAAGPLTYYIGVTGASDLNDGMQVEVHGAYAADANGQGYIQATLIRLLPATNAVTRTTGMVTNLNPAAGTFRIGAMTVQFDSSTSITPGALGLANGQLVNVWSNSPLLNNGSTIVAGAIAIRTLRGTSGPVQIGGLISMQSGGHFEVSGIPIDATAPALSPVVKGLGSGQYVVVQGTVDAATGIVSASSIRTYSAQPAQVELRGTITGYTSLSAFFVRGVLVNAAQATFLNDSNASMLANGVFVDIVGNVTGDTVTASSMSVLTEPPDGSTVDYQGTVSQLDGSKGTFVLTLPDGTTHNVTLAPNVAYGNGNATKLVNGASVEIEATNTASGLEAYSVSF